ncbi:HepT-like ribonuclease domain-containing protein [Natrarchaeobaculum aegyptiacum]|uniref:HepT-like ribonuclease domain-containing protein n=1 Tax=Natrarchaeobaculum aegyptiacum TaxID=745377 RepID=UPI001E5CFA9D|nr:HepT-like ribonuclease domain-containing protein [Natrarchaeobaculum aegyptiacum]
MAPSFAVTNRRFGSSNLRSKLNFPSVDPTSVDTSATLSIESRSVACVADEGVVAVKLEQIEQYHRELKEKQATLSCQDLRTNTTEQRAVERMFENVIQACADLAQHVGTHDFGYYSHVNRVGERRLFIVISCFLVEEMRCIGRKFEFCLEFDVASIGREYDIAVDGSQ